MFKFHLSSLINQNVNLNDNLHPQVIPSIETVQQLSTTITAILYDSLTSTNTWQENQRLDILLFLKKLCGRSEHFRISPKNYITCLLEHIQHADYLNHHEKSSIDVLEHNEIAKFSNPSLLIISHFEKLQGIHERRKKHLEMIYSRDGHKCSNETFNLHRFLCNDMEVQNVSGLMQFNNNTVCERNRVKTFESYHPSFDKKPERLKEDLIIFAYSLVNFDYYINGLHLLPAILKTIASRTEINSYEHTFISYIWNNHGKLSLPSGLLLLLLESYHFVYEVPIIKMATSVLQAQTTTLCVPEDVQVILNLACDSKKLQFNLKSLLYELYACSNYNSKLDCLLLLL